jgi:3-deoxy-7-phosphoheptulonate synthase
MVWIGDRTRMINGRHLDFVSKLDNPIGVKIGPSIKIDEITKICTKVNPNNEKGKLIFIIRLGEKNIEKILPKIIKKVKHYGHEIIWFCDPMHGNTIKSQNGYKTRHFKTIINELESFFDIHKSEKTIPGGVHIELTGENVTECLGGINNIKDKDLDLRYETACDPRLNNEQSLEIAFLISKLIKKRKNNE